MPPLARGHISNRQMIFARGHVSLPTLSPGSSRLFFLIQKAEKTVGTRLFRIFDAIIEMRDYS